MVVRKSVDVQVKDVIVGVSRLIDRLHDFSEPFREISADFQRIEQARFDAEGPGWAPLSPSTLRRKAGGQIMVETGALRDSLTGGPGYIETITDFTAVFGTGDRKAVFHQSGTRFMPARPLINVGMQDVVGWVKIMQAYAAREIRKVGLD